MGWTRVRAVAGLLSMVLVGGVAVPPRSGAVSATTQGAVCADHQPGQILFLTVRDLTYRSYGYVNTEQFALAALLLENAADMVAAIADPYHQSEVVSLLVGTTGGQPNSLAQLVDRSVATQQPELALGVLAKISPAAQGLQGEYGVINHQRAMLVQLAEYYLQLGQPAPAREHLDHARSLLELLPGDGWGLRAAPVAEGYVSLGDRQSAIAILDAARRHTEAMMAADPDPSVPVLRRTNEAEYLSSIFQAIAIAYAKAGALEAALAAVDAIPLLNIQASTLAAITREGAATTSPDQRESLGQRMTALVQGISSTSPDQARAALALAYGHLGQWPQALEWVGSLSSPDLKIQTLTDLAIIGADRPDLVSTLLADLVATAQGLPPFTNGDLLQYQAANQYIAQQRYGLAWALIQRIDAGSMLHSDTLMALIRATSAAGEFELAQQAVAILDPGWNNQVRSQALLTMVQGYLQAGQGTAALSLLPDIEDNPYLPYQVLARIAIARFYRQNNQPDLALEHLNQGVQDLHRLLPTVNVSSLGQIILELNALGQGEQVQALLTTALAWAYTSNITTADGISSLVHQFLYAQNYPLALGLVQSLESTVEGDLVASLMVEHLLDMGEMAIATQVITTLQDPHRRVELGVKIADYYRALGQPQAAADWLAQSFGLAAALPGPDQVSYGDASQRDHSIPARDPRDRGSLLEAIALRYGEMGQWAAAQQAVQALESPADQAALQQRLECIGWR